MGKELEELRERVAKALGLQKGIPGVKKSAPANQHYYRKHEYFDYEVERVTATTFENAEKDIDNVEALIQQARIQEAEVARYQIHTTSTRIALKAKNRRRIATLQSNKQEDK